MRPEESEFLEGLYRGNLNKLLLYAQVHLTDRSKAMDVVQDTFHEAARSIGPLTVHPNPEGWLMQTLKNKLREYNRSHAADQRMCLSLDAELPPVVGRRDEGLDRLDAGEEPAIDRVRQILTPEELYLFERLVLDDASHLELARELGVTVWACQKRFGRIKQKLRKNMPK